MIDAEAKPAADRPRPRAAGFTLLELLLAAMLAAVLMLGVWSLFGMYVRLFQTGQSKAEQAQLVRGLTEQLADDLHGAIQDPIPGQPMRSRGAVAVRRFGLFGTQTELRCDVLQITPFAGSLTPTSDREGPAGRAPLRAPELRTVYYRFEPFGVPGGGESSVQPGLSRRELDFETPYLAEDEAGLDGLSPADGSRRPAGPLAAGSQGGLLVVDPNDDSVMLAPEVIDCGFRYFDGRSWSSQWNSLQRKSLPVAVEVTLEVSSLDEREELFQAEREGEDAGPETPAGTGLAAPQDFYPTYRLVIDLPGAPMHSAPRQVRKTAVTQLRDRAARRYRPRPTAPRRTERVDLSDQWMRTER